MIYYQRYTTNDSLSTIHYQRRAAFSNIRRTCCSCQWRRRRYDRYRTDAPRVLPKEIRRKGADRRCCPLPRSFGLASPFVCCRCWRVLASVLVVVVGRRAHRNRRESLWKRIIISIAGCSVRAEVVQAGVRIRGSKSNAFECLFYKRLPCLRDKQIRTEIGNLGIDKDQHINCYLAYKLGAWIQQWKMDVRRQERKWLYLRCYTMIIPTKHPASKLVRGLTIIHSKQQPIPLDNSWFLWTTADSFRQQFLFPFNQQPISLDNSSPSLITTPNSFRQHHRRLQPTVSRLHPTPLFASEQQFGSDRRRRPRLSHAKRSAFSDGRRFYSERLLQLIPIPSSKSRDSFIDRQPFGDHSAAVQRLLGNFSANLRRLLGKF